MSRVRRFDHVGLTVADLDVVTAFFVALGLDVEGMTPGALDVRATRLRAGLAGRPPRIIRQE